MPDVPETLAARADLCRLLAACYYQPGPEFAEECVFESMRAAAERFDPQLAASASRMGGDFAAEGAERLLLDYTRLFLGPTGVLAHPYESMWREDPATAMGKSTLEVQDLYRLGGLAIDDEFHELPDHVACELEFLYLLLFRENQARAGGEHGDTASAAALRRRFIEEHLGAWIGAFTAAVGDCAQTHFYRELATMTQRFVGLEARALAAQRG